MSRYRYQLRKKTSTAVRKTTAESDNRHIEEEDESTVKAKKRGGSIHSVKAKTNLGKRGRRKASGGPIAPRPNPDDPGNEIAAANKDRPKGIIDRIRGELSGGPKPAYKRGGRPQKSQRYDAGGPVVSNAPDFAHTAKINPIVKFVQDRLPPVHRNLTQPPRLFSSAQLQALAQPAQAVRPNVMGPVGARKGGRVERGSKRKGAGT